MRAGLLLAGVAAAAGGAAAWLASTNGAEQRSPASAAAAACGPSPVESPYPGMVFVPSGSFTMGADNTFPEEGPASQQSVDGFWMDRTEVTNAKFAEFVAATGYRTLAERGVRVTAAAAPASTNFARISRRLRSRRRTAPTAAP